jgi:hypothetical protein
MSGDKKIPSKEERREGTYVPPDDDSAISPGGQQPKPTEDPRKDSGLYPKEEEPSQPQPKKPTT